MKARTLLGPIGVGVVSALSAAAPAWAQVSCSGVPAFASCTSYASGASVVYNNVKYTSIAPIPSNRDCPPSSPFNPSTDNWWTNNGTCSGGATATRTATATSTARATATPTTSGRSTATRTNTPVATATSRPTARATATTARPTATFTSGPTATPTGSIAYAPCTIDVSHVGAACSGSNPASCDGADIAQNYALWPDPYQCYVCAPGVTLMKGSKCDTSGVKLVWNATSEQCILNGQGYPLSATHACSNGHYMDGVTPDAYNTLVSDWYQIATTMGRVVAQPNAGANAYVVTVTLENGQQVDAAMAMGHGVLDGKCGATFLIKVGTQYVLLLQTDVRAWSLEVSPGANTWLDQTNVGGTCIIPEVRKIDASFVIHQFL
jgi:hypothetical protein